MFHMNLRAAIFDLDYTLIDASEAIFYCIKHSLNKMGYPEPTREAAVATIGLSFVETYKVLTSDASVEKGKEFGAHFVKYAQDEKQQYLDNTSLFDTAIPLLKYLRKQGCKIAMVTSKTRDCVNDILAKFNLNQYFDYIVGFDEIEIPKPHPMGILKALTELDVAASQAIYIGDSVVDAEAANRAGVTFIAVLTGQTKNDGFQQYKCHSLLNDLSGIPALLPTIYFSAFPEAKKVARLPTLNISSSLFANGDEGSAVENDDLTVQQSLVGGLSNN
jgi:phosphoglycolate phosphatase